MKDFFNLPDGGMLAWATNFKTQIALIGSSVGLTDAQIAELQNSCDNITNALNAKIAAKNTYSQKVNEASTVLATEGQTFHSIANIVKASPGYTAGKGSSLGIINLSNAAFDPTTYKPDLAVTTGNGFVNVKYTKKGVIGINIYTRLQGTAAWTHLILSTHSPYHDHHPLIDPAKPETREYMVIGVQNDAEIGIPSDIVSITFAG